MMLEQFTWGDFLTTVVIITVCYYSAIAAICCREEIKNLFFSGRATQLSDNTGPDSAAPEVIDPFDGMEEIMTKINSILDTADKTVSKDELLSQLNEVLANHPGLRISAYRGAVLKHIIKKAEALCGIGISEDELKG